MEVKYQSELDAGTVSQVSTGIDIPDLPPMAPPSTVNAQNMLIAQNGRLADILTYDNWLDEML